MGGGRVTTFEMTTDRLRNAITARPFRPFVVHLADGKTLRVPHPDFIFVSAGGRTVLIVEGEGDHEQANILELLLVTRLEFDPLAPAGRRTGQG